MGLCVGGRRPILGQAVKIGLVLLFNVFSFFFIRQEKVIFPTLFMGN